MIFQRYQQTNGPHVIFPLLTAGRPGLSASRRTFTISPGAGSAQILLGEKRQNHFVGRRKKDSSNFQLFYFNYCYNEASCLGALSRYQIKREETSDEGGVLLQSQKEHEF